MTPAEPDPAVQARARDTALALAGAHPPHARGFVTYRARSCLLVIGRADRLREVLPRIAESLKIVAFARGPDVQEPPPAGATWVVGQIVELSGHLGKFTARSLGKAGQHLDCGPFSENRDGYFDLVLDLGQPPMIDAEIAPPGYYAPADEAALARALTDLPALVGAFRKPRYFDYDPGICVHGARSIAGCARCLAACPTRAIASRGDRVEVDAFLCQGCGTCAAVCPTGALDYAYPATSESLARLRAMLESFHAAGGTAPIIVVHERKAALDAALSANPDFLPFEIHGLGALGLDAWLAALAYGARQIMLVAESAMSRSAVRAIVNDLEACRALLEAVGDDPRRVTLLENGDPESLSEAFTRIAAPPRPTTWTRARFAAPREKRARIFAFLDHLVLQADARNLAVTLPGNMPFGAVEVDQAACTVCLACASLCPTNALTAANEDQAELRFVEGDCVQCGICVAGCPERAISLMPRLTFDAAARGHQRTLAEAQLFRCVECGSPFISRAVLESSMRRLKDHPMLSGDGVRLLQLCMECRQKATFGRITLS